MMPIKPPRPTLICTPSPTLTLEPVTAVKVLVLAAPIDTPPVIAPALVKVLPAADVSNAIRPLMTPVLLLVMLTCEPP
ncbi:hypothetical protein D3C78_1739680 [compost metagenome]